MTYNKRLNFKRLGGGPKVMVEVLDGVCFQEVMFVWCREGRSCLNSMA